MSVTIFRVDEVLWYLHVVLVAMNVFINIGESFVVVMQCLFLIIFQ
jgi:hypothetical protein